ncbi:acylphosphatase-2-like [Tachypleus tridentatus]|uniref:acylphosphatase-2-like n=1 Tax=Tachypleus tridentatus TaxID=6853 RepID=UPI003FD2FF4F
MAFVKMVLSVDFEVFGRVQGLYEVMFTKDKAKELGLKGWVMNTHRDTVVGTIQGENDKIMVMREWLRTTGSPYSRIEKCEFKNEKSISKPEFRDFSVKH